MPTYELSLMLRQMTRPEMITTLRRTAETIFDRGGFLRKIENLGFRNLPYKTSEHGVVHRTGTPFIIKFDAPPTAVADLHEEFGRDVDIVKRLIFKVEEFETKKQCTLQDELQPPAYRKEVIKMMEIAKRGQKEKYPQHTGLKYYPFQK